MLSRLGYKLKESIYDADFDPLVWAFEMKVCSPGGEDGGN